MKRMSILFVAALAMVGCKKSGGGGGDCEQAISHSLDLAKDSLPKDAKLQGQLKDIGVEHCKADKWSAEAVKCMIDAKSEADGQACYGKLSKEQQTKMNEAAMKLAMPSEPNKAPAAPEPAPGGGSAPAPTEPAAGSAAGSAPAAAGGW